MVSILTLQNFQEKLVKKILAAKLVFMIYIVDYWVSKNLFSSFSERESIMPNRSVRTNELKLEARRKWNVSHRSIERNETNPSIFFDQTIKLRRLRSEVELETRIFKNGTGRFCRTVWSVEEDLLWKWSVLDRRAKQLLSTKAFNSIYFPTEIFGNSA